MLHIIMDLHKTLEHVLKVKIQNNLVKLSNYLPKYILTFPYKNCCKIKFHITNIINQKKFDLSTSV